MTSLSVSVELPFRDQSGATRSQRFPASAQQGDDTVTVTLRLIDNWVRMLYGALAFPGFQSEPARLRISYTYEGYVRIDTSRLELLYGGKIARLPIVYNPQELPLLHGKPYLDAQDGTYHLPTGVLHFSRELPADRRGAPRAGNGEQGAPAPAPRRGGGYKARSRATSTHEEAAFTTVSTAVDDQPEAETPGLRPVELTALAVSPILAAVPIALNNTMAIHPQLEVATLAEVLPEKQYALQTLGTTLQAAVLYRCEQFGALYAQETQEGLQTIACKDILKLGQAEYKQYRLLTDVAFDSPFYSVYRSLQMPERFLVVPAAYRITRFGPDEGEKAYRPSIFLYTTIDAENLEDSRCVIMSTLQPDVPAYARRELADKLNLLFHRPPLVEYITEIEGQVQYEWNILTTGPHPVQAQVAKLWDSFQVSLSSDVDGIPQLQAMLEGGTVAARVIFTLPDGTALETSLRLDLRGITGPWEGGPLEVSLQGGSVRLLNRIDENAVNVDDLRAYVPGQAAQTVQVDRQLGKGESWTGPAPAGTTEIYPVYTLQASGPASLPEIRSFIEDIHTNVVFLNQVTYANHDLKKLDIIARIKDLAGRYSVSIPGEQTPASLDIVLPLTSFLANPVLQFQVIKTDTSDQATHTPWLDWPLSTMGSIVSLTWSLIGTSQA